MKKFLNKFVMAAALVALVFTSCDDGLTDLNVDPNNPVEVPPQNLVTQGQYQLYNLLHGRTLNGEWGMLMVQQWSQNEYTEESRYLVDANSFNTSWTNFYASVLNELDVARKLVAQNETLPASIRANQTAIIDIMMVQGFHSLTDHYGAVPYSQALNSVDFPLPSYDSQQAVYTGILATLENAIAAIDEGQVSFETGEIVYNGDMAKWKKLANSLMLRIAMRMVDVDEATASRYINQAASGAFTSNDDNAYFVFESDANVANPLFVDNVVNNRDDFSMSEVLVETLRMMGDPRLDVYSALNVQGEHVGIPYGLLDAAAVELKANSSRPAAAVREATAPHVIMDYAEVQFILAEAYQRGILSGDAAVAYAEGIKASMEYWIPGVDQAAIDAYVAANAYDAGNWKESLGVQKWLAFYMSGPQAWAEWRRLDYPQLPVPADAVNDIIPLRLPYPINEETTNGTNLFQVTNSADDLNTRMWWDVN